MSDLAAVQTQLETTNQQIASVQNELEVLQGSIAQLNTDIQDKETNWRIVSISCSPMSMAVS